MFVNVMNGLHEKCQSVNQASFLECEPSEVFLHGCHTLVSVPVLVIVSGTFILDGFECLDSDLLMLPYFMDGRTRLLYISHLIVGVVPCVKLRRTMLSSLSLLLPH